MEKNLSLPGQKKIRSAGGERFSSSQLSLTFVIVDGKFFGGTIAGSAK
jgi:hypothetical protein